MAENAETTENIEDSIVTKEATEEFEPRDTRVLTEEEIQKLVALAAPKSTARELLWDKLREAYRQGELAHGHKHRQENAVLQTVLMQLDAALTALSAISQRELSCDHETLYAGGVESPGYRIYTYKEFAENALENIREFEELSENKEH